MPIYDFYCTHCFNEFESLISPTAPAECPRCKTREVDKRPSVIGGYSAIKNNDASARPAGAGSRPKGKPKSGNGTRRTD